MDALRTLLQLCSRQRYYLEKQRPCHEMHKVELLVQRVADQWERIMEAGQLAATLTVRAVQSF